MNTDILKNAIEEIETAVAGQERACSDCGVSLAEHGVLTGVNVGTREENTSNMWVVCSSCGKENYQYQFPFLVKERPAKKERESKGRIQGATILKNLGL